MRKLTKKIKISPQQILNNKIKILKIKKIFKIKIACLLKETSKLRKKIEIKIKTTFHLTLAIIWPHKIIKNTTIIYFKAIIALPDKNFWDTINLTLCSIITTRSLTLTLKILLQKLTGKKNKLKTTLNKTTQTTKLTKSPLREMKKATNR